MFLPFYEFLSIDNKYRKIILLFLLLFQGHRHGNQIIATSQEHLNLRLIQSDQVLDLSWEIVWIYVSYRERVELSTYKLILFYQIFYLIYYFWQ